MTNMLHASHIHPCWHLQRQRMIGFPSVQAAFMSDANVDDFLDRVDIGQELAIECGTALQLEVDGVDTRVASQFVGMEADRFLIVRTPTMSQFGGISIKLYTGNRVVVRYVFDGSVYGFETTIMDSISSPVRLLFLAYPKVINERNIRSNRRVHTTLPATVELGDQSAEGTITDISLKGCQLAIRSDRLPESAAAKVGDAIALTLQLPGVAGELNLSGTIKNTGSEGKAAQFGVEFGELDENVLLAIDSYVKLSF